MIEGQNHTLQAFLGTLFTWALTAAGAALVICIKGPKQKLLDGSLGFAAGVMTAASFWSLLAPAIEKAEVSKLYGENGEYAFIPVGIGFFLGALFVYGADLLINTLGVTSPDVMLGKLNQVENVEGIQVHSFEGYNKPDEMYHVQWKRILLLVIAITVHNIPEGLAVGVGFGAIGSSNLATFESARNLAIGIGIQNFPEGLAVSLPLHAAGYSMCKSFWYGQLSGMVEPIFGVLGAVTVSLAEPVLPYALAFAAGAMIYVVVNDIIPEANSHNNGKLASWGTILGFLVMMSLDVGLG